MTRTRRAPLAAGGPLLALALALAPAVRAQAQDADVARRLDQLEAGQKRIERQLEEIKRLVQAQAQPQPSPAARPAGPDVAGLELDLGDNPVKGQPSAGLVLVEFTDYQ